MYWGPVKLTVVAILVVISAYFIRFVALDIWESDQGYSSLPNPCYGHYISVVKLDGRRALVARDNNNFLAEKRGFVVLQAGTFAIDEIGDLISCSKDQVHVVLQVFGQWGVYEVKIERESNQIRYVESYPCCSQESQRAGYVPRSFLLSLK